MELQRRSGVLLHPTSLPGRFGIGDLGEEAREFAQHLADAGQSWWQILPLNPTGQGGSPYASSSAFALHNGLIDPRQLAEEGWITDGELEEYAQNVPRDGDLDAVVAHKEGLIDLAFSRWNADDHPDFEAYLEGQSDWLEDYALFAALKAEHDGRPWYEWEEGVVRRDPNALAEAHIRLATSLRKVEFEQWLVDRQWRSLHAFAADLGVRIIGDIPIFVAMDSADVWANRKYFRVDESGHADVVAGVPPDYFSAEGQKWGNPLYDWDALAADGFGWWIMRVERAMETTDLVRIDHFRAFADYWEVPADAPNAVQGEWLDGPGDAFFDAIGAALGDVPFIAEDLGIVTDEVYALRDRHHLPGMKILQFAFDGSPDHPFLPHTYPERCVAYPGTHDNNTLRGWMSEASHDELHQARSYFSSSNDELPRAMMERLMESRARLVVLQMQDILELGAEARMNTPGTVRGNWGWRMSRDQLDATAPWSWLREVTSLGDRLAE